MKENKRMGKARKISVIAMLLCLAVMMGCFLNGTFAKYTTKAEGSDTARVAKWGIELNADSDVFSPTYKADDKSYEVGVNSVESANGEDVIAPGTSGSMSFSISGAPETALRLETSLGEYAMASVGTQGASTGEIKAVNDGYYVVKGFSTRWESYEAGDYYGRFAPADPRYRDNVKYFRRGEVVVAGQTSPGEVYYPMEWKLEKDQKTLAEGNLAKIEEYLMSISKDYEPNSEEFANICGEYTLTWKWAFESGSDELDTVLGNAAAGIDTEGYHCNLTEAFNFSISATQID